MMMMTNLNPNNMPNQPPTQNPSPAPEQGSDLTPLNIIRTETILSKLPIHNLAKKGKVDIQITRLGPRGELELKWEVSYSERYGQAGQLAYKLDTIVINTAIDEAGRPLPERLCLGSLRDIAKKLDLGGNTNLVRKALRQNASAFIVARFSYKTNDGGERTLEAAFTRYSVVLTGEKFPDGTRADAVYITFNPDFREVLNHAPLRPLNLDYMKSLAPAPQRFYEIVSYKIFAALKYNQPVAKLSYAEYCTFSAQQRYFDYDHFKKQMYKIHRPHLLSGYIAKVHFDPATDEEGKADWTMCYVPGPKARAEYAHFTAAKKRAIDVVAQLPAGESVPRHPRQSHPNPKSAAPELQPQAPPPVVDHRLVAELTRRGISETDARAILAGVPPGQAVLDQLEWADFQIAQTRGKIANPPGFYISLLQRNVIPPPAFETSTIRIARQRAEFEQAQALQREAEAQQAAEAAADAELDHILAADPARYHTLYVQARAQIVASHPRIGDFLRSHPGSGLHDGAIRARMKHFLQVGAPAPEAAPQLPPPKKSKAKG